jgi:hypothetical protein
MVADVGVRKRRWEIWIKGNLKSQSTNKRELM